MSHITGTLQTLGSPLNIGPDTGQPPTGPNTWASTFHPVPAPAPGGLKFAILHFTGVSLPANNRLEVDLGYDMDVFTSADGNDFWTRPVNVATFAGGNIPIRYITNGAANGIAQLTQYGRGERHSGKQDPTALSNSDPFLLEAQYTEGKYDPLWICDANNINWENIQCLANVNDIRRKTAPSVGMIVHVYHDSDLNQDLVSTCSVTLIGADQIITAGHCIEDNAMEIGSASVIFNYETNCDWTHSNTYSGKFYKVKKVLKRRWLDPNFPSYDYCLLQLKTPIGGIPVPPCPIRNGLPAVGEQVFGIHHPNGAIKKLSPISPAFTTVNNTGSTFINVLNLDVSGGSSGSGIFDSNGRIMGVLSNGGKCNLFYFPIVTILQDIAATPVPSPGRDVMLVFDKSGSMSLPAGTGKTKIQEARDAASLFVQLIQTGGGNKLGLASFSTAAIVDENLSAINVNKKDALIGNAAPYTGGKIGMLNPGGSTSIGGGLQAAQGQFGGGNNLRTILLFTDGLQNTPPMIDAVNPTLTGDEIHVIGFGTESSLDGTLLTQLAQQHNGLYTRAGDPLNLKKFFAMAFGNIFLSGTLADPLFFLPAATMKAKPMTFPICGEEHITVVCGWDKTTSPLFMQLQSPGGNIISAGMAGVESSTGNTWTFIKLNLPFAGEQDGSWTVIVNRTGSGSEFPAQQIDLNYFINVIVKGGPELKIMQRKTNYFTGDTINPMVSLATLDGDPAHGAKVKVKVIRPNESIGNILSRTKLKAANTIDSDTLPLRQSNLQTIESETGKQAINYVEEIFDLSDDPENAGGYLESHGIYGKVFTDLLKKEGNYTFHIMATYGEVCKATKELIWTIHVDSGIDGGKTVIKTTVVSVRADGKKQLVFTLTPKDKYGNNIGPGRADVINVTGVAGTSTDGLVTDNGDGTYTVNGTWDATGTAPGITITQPGRNAVVVTDKTLAETGDKTNWKLWFWLLLLLFIILLLLFFLLK
ncbi:MAG TPA: trypsin-like peptidase domain-containing protein [Chitinophagaceae bacterium]|nr:trypsin-like peptidase domain-containing protein [Chitinophagaceae bacterium]